MLLVQRVEQQVSGPTMKHRHIGALELVPVAGDILTIGAHLLLQSKCEKQKYCYRSLFVLGASLNM